MKRINLIIPCTATKAISGGPDMANMPISDSMEELHALWAAELSKCPTMEAGKLYTGKTWGLYRETYAELSKIYTIDSYVISAGYGIVKMTDMISPYNCSFSAAYKTPPTSRVSGRSTKSEWWSQLRSPELKDFSIMCFPGTYTQLAVEFILKTNGFLIAGSKSCIPAALRNYPLITCTTGHLPIPAISKHGLTSLHWAIEHVKGMIELN